MASASAASQARSWAKTGSLDRHLASVPVITLFSPCLERALVGGTLEELIAIDQMGKRYRLAPQGMDDVSIIDNVFTLAVRHRPTASERYDPRGTKKPSSQSSKMRTRKR